MTQTILFFHTPFNGEYLGYVVPKKRHGDPGPEQLLSLLGAHAALNHQKMLTTYFAEKEKELSHLRKIPQNKHGAQGPS